VATSGDFCVVTDIVRDAGEPDRLRVGEKRLHVLM